MILCDSLVSKSSFGKWPRLCPQPAPFNYHLQMDSCFWTRVPLFWITFPEGPIIFQLRAVIKNVDSLFSIQHPVTPRMAHPFLQDGEESAPQISCFLILSHFSRLAWAALFQNLLICQILENSIGALKFWPQWYRFYAHTWWNGMRIPDLK